ncbi:uncharacterized protein DNG_08029 [Cephalotrichum gorgonifer]|uniref:Uncharacterized protein n=1 Tax=Cephalotrichum gorgonifer TaxID=2041049 RepID=A0AAE8SYS7_9PEZI|nr:uncharacterized protein DNG_08029 [Cephalotrichum gorgonifer]
MERIRPVDQPSDRREYQPEYQQEHQPEYRREHQSEYQREYQPQPQEQEREYRQEYQSEHRTEYQQQRQDGYSSKSPEAQPVTPGASSSGAPLDHAAKVPPSRFQKRKGSIFATPSTRDGHCNTNTFEKYYAKVAEMRGRRLSHFDPTNPPQTK